MATSKPFIHLRSHSAYSLLEGAIKLPSLLKLADKFNMPAIALTDTGNLFGALEFSEKAQSMGIQPIIGCQVLLSLQSNETEVTRALTMNGGNDLSTIVLLAMTETGYANLVRLVSKSYTEKGPEQQAIVSFDQLKKWHEGLICLSGGINGPLDQLILHCKEEQARARAALLKDLFGDRFYIELQRLRFKEEAEREDKLISLAYELEIPLVATNEPFFETKEDYEAHDALICISEGAVIGMDDRRRLTDQCYFKSSEEMRTLFRDLPEAIDNTVEIAQRCHVGVPLRDPILPQFAAKGLSGDAAVAAEAVVLRKQAHKGLEARLAFSGYAPERKREDYIERLDFELDVIEKMKFPGYFLIVADFIKFAKAESIPVGPGRGSGAGSLVAWALTITDLDPLRFSLLFERFLNPERISMPDFDIDFCQDRRDEVIRYVQERYGRDQVAQIITFGSLQARAVLRDVGRVLQMPYGQVDRLCKLVPNNPANPVTLQEAIDGEPKLQEAAEKEEVVDRLLSMSLKLEGLYRHASTHAAGIVIGDRPLEELVPLYRDPRSDMPVTQFNMKWVEQSGLVKFDFLGLKTLTVLQKTIDLLQLRDVTIDLQAIPLDDRKTYDMLSRGETVGVFQLESQGMRKALLGMRPDMFEDIIALVALYRPGPMDNIPVYNRRKHGEEKPDYIHPRIERYLKETQGVIIYQEQVMQIAQELAGYSLGEADVLRRAMGKKIKQVMEEQRKPFVERSVERGLSVAKANEIFDLLAKFASYGFNKSHAAAYALLAYQTAYLKANYPVEFMAATMTLDSGNTDKLHDFKRETERLGFKLEIPNINKSEVEFSVSGNTIYYALSAIKGVGQQAVGEIVKARPEGGFRDLADFAHRLDPKSINRRLLENLVCAGAFDCLVANRAQVFNSIEQIVALAQRQKQALQSQQDDMFSAISGPEPICLKPIAEFDLTERLAREHASIGFYLSAHPLDRYSAMLKKLQVKPWIDFEQQVKQGVTFGKIAGTIVAKQERNTRTGNRMAIFQITDPTGQFEAVCFSETLTQHRDALEAGRSIVMTVAAEDRPQGVGLRINTVEPLDEAVSRFEGALDIFIRDEKPLKQIARHLQDMQTGRGCEVRLNILDDDNLCEVQVALQCRYVVPLEIADAFRKLPGIIDARLQ